jgi:hypothetical protein
MMFWVPFSALADEAKIAVMYKYPECGCCEEYARYLRKHGFEIVVKPTNDMDFVKEMAGVPEQMEGCHTLMIDGYVVEGHVPVRTLKRLLSERPPITGISLPDMPQGSPGMTGIKSEPFEIYAITGEKPRLYAIE